MSAIAIAALLVLFTGIVLGLYAWLAPRRVAERMRVREGSPLQVTTAWTNEAGEEFAGLSEAARCDLVFAVAALDDERSQRLLEHALNDPAEAVSLAAAHALAGHGRRPVVEAFLADHPGARADRIAQALAVLD
ncbi:MAG TPA: hypothetical protein VMF11_00880 [Candidatus Baltobacteraceae bacterium]|nr:hypothetical protein [Candidatus Baltobacteraceae bacterium]